jgi:hypothetical protein
LSCWNSEAVWDCVYLRDVEEFKFSSASDAPFDIRAITEERFARALFLSLAFSSAKCAIAEVFDSVAMI